MTPGLGAACDEAGVGDVDLTYPDAMVMADRPEVETASKPIAALTMVGLGESLLNGLARVPFSKPWKGPSGLLDNIGQAVTRNTIRAFMGYSMGLPIE